MRIVIAAGGTGGHLYPAVALAREFLRQDRATEVLFVGTARGIESKVLPHEGFALQMIAARPVMGRGWRQAVLACLSLPVAVRQAVAILRARRADLVIGVGGYSSPPVILAAWLLRIRRVLLEPNASPGLANKATGPLADLVFLSYGAAAGSFSSAKVRVTGMPIRREFYEEATRAGGDAETRGRGDTTALLHPPVAASPRRTDRPVYRLLVFGGSQGAHAINQAMVEALPHVQAMKDRLAIVHQTGESDCASVRAAYVAAGLEAEVTPFIYDMPKALRSADLVVSRAGAITLAELSACGKPAILVPLPTAIYQHQEKNALVMEQAGAAVLLRQSELTGTSLANQIAALLSDAGRLRSMGERSAALGRPDASETIVEMCRKLLKEDYGTNQPLGATRS
ncbi:MAG: undecaprenyldiphospho-muramoylpentapeptide beta-N-acetylglucosaminyltransferase [Nitrospirae bacterium]|nr:MAG: undecaprenyldiphospho-muramoylpentapeptide beta-N-acetylglucosaminyltransferase [Nitrospirota bacterium]